MPRKPQNPSDVSREGEQRILQALDASGHGVWDWDLLTGNCYYSPSWKAMLGYTGDELADRIEEWERLTEPDDVAAMYAALRQHAATGERFRQEMRIRGKDGSIKYIVVRGQVVEWNADRQPARMVGTAADLTAWKSAADATPVLERRLLLALDHIGDGVWERDLVTGTVYYSPRWKALLGYADEEIGNGFDEWLRLILPDDVELVLSGMRRHIENGEPFDVECRIRCKDDSVKWILARGKVTARDKKGKPLRMIGTHTDITERKRAVENLRRASERLQLAARAASIGIWDWDIVKDQLVWDDAMYRLYGVRKQDYNSAYEAWAGALVPEDLERANAEIQAALRGEREFSPEFRVVWPDGSVHFIKAASQTFRDASRRPLRMVGVNYDVTERKRAEQALRESEERFSKAFQASPMIVAINAVRGTRYIEVNRAFEVSTGFRREEVIGRSVMEVGLFQDLVRIEAAFQKLYIDGSFRDFEVPVRTKSGALGLARLSAEMIEVAGELCILTVAEDITDRRQAEELVNLLQTITMDVAAAGDLMSALELVLRRVCEKTGWAIGQAWLPETEGPRFRCSAAWYASGEELEAFHEASRELIVRSGVGLPGRVWASRQPVWIPDVTNDTNFPRAAAASAAGLKAALGVPIAAGGDVIAVLEFFLRESRREDERLVKLTSAVAEQIGQAIGRKHVEAALHQYEQRFASIFRESPVALVVSERDSGRYTEVNEAMLRLMHASSVSDLVGHTSVGLGFLTPDQREWMIATLHEKGRVDKMELPLRRLDGQSFISELSISSYQSEGKEFLLSNVVDITERKQAEQDRQAKEVADAANLAKSTFLANMSHEIRTPMNAILGFAQLMRRDATLSEQSKQHLDIINRSGEYLLALINDILEMSRIEAGRATANVSGFDLLSLIDDLEMLFQVPASEKGLTLRVDRSPGLPRNVVTDHAKVRQILINLLANAIKFTPSGTVTLRVSAMPDAGSDVVPLVVEVEDTGQGILAEDIDRVFQQFEQTEAARRVGGTGLGLAISRQFARLLGGDITVTSRIGRGSTFRLSLNVMKGDATLAAERSAPRRVTGIAAGARRRVLVVDDKEDNRALLTQMLGGVGYETAEGREGGEALEIAATWRPDLILMDLRMPGMDGFEAIRRLRERRASAKIIAVTASAFLDNRDAAIALGADDFVAKPVKEDELLSKVAAALDVQYTYADDGRPVPSARQDAGGLSAAVLDALPADLVAELRAATLRADYDGILGLIDKLQAVAPDVAAALRPRVERFEYQHLLDLLPD